MLVAWVVLFFVELMALWASRCFIVSVEQVPDGRKKDTMLTPN